MAKVVITADTETGEMLCEVNGKTLDNVSYAQAYTSTKYNDETGNYDKPCACISISMKAVKEDGVTYNMSAYAKHQKNAESAIESGKAEFLCDDIVLVPDLSTVSRDIAKALKFK